MNRDKLKSQSGQALVESLVAIVVSIAFFVSAIGLQLKILKSLKQEQQSLGQQLCKMAGGSSAYCKDQKGFILISTLLQISVLLFGSMTTYLLMAFKDIQFETLEHCFHNSLSILERQNSSPELVKDLSAKVNSLLLQTRPRINDLAKIQSTVNFPKLEYQMPDKKLTSVVYDLNFKITTIRQFNFFTLTDSDFHLRCGAKVTCEKQKCTYALVADKF